MALHTVHVGCKGLLDYVLFGCHFSFSLTSSKKMLNEENNSKTNCQLLDNSFLSIETGKRHIHNCAVRLNTDVAVISYGTRA